MLKNESISSCSIQYLISRKRSEVSKSAQLSKVSTSSHPSFDLVFFGAVADERNVDDTAFTFFFDFEGSTACDGPGTGLFGGS